MVIERAVPERIEADGEADSVLMMDMMMLALGVWAMLKNVS